MMMDLVPRPLHSQVMEASLLEDILMLRIRLKIFISSPLDKLMESHLLLK